MVFAALGVLVTSLYQVVGNFFFFMCLFSRFRKFWSCNPRFRKYSIETINCWEESLIDKLCNSWWRGDRKTWGCDAHQMPVCKCTIPILNRVWGKFAFWVFLLCFVLWEVFTKWAIRLCFISLLIIFYFIFYIINRVNDKLLLRSAYISRRLNKKKKNQM